MLLCNLNCSQHGLAVYFTPVGRCEASDRFGAHSSSENMNLATCVFAQASPSHSAGIGIDTGAPTAPRNSIASWPRPRPLVLLRPAAAVALGTVANVPVGTGSATSCSIRLDDEPAGEGGSEAKPISVIDSAGDAVAAVCIKPELLRLLLLSRASVVCVCCWRIFAGGAVDRSRGISTGGAAVVLRSTAGACRAAVADRELLSRPVAAAAREVGAAGS